MICNSETVGTVKGLNDLKGVFSGDIFLKYFISFKHYTKQHNPGLGNVSEYSLEIASDLYEGTPPLMIFTLRFLCHLILFELYVVIIFYLFIPIKDK